MRIFIISLSISTLIAWFTVNALISMDHTATSTRDPAPARISLLGNVNIEDATSNTFIFDGFAAIQTKLSQITAASQDQLKQWFITLRNHANPPRQALQFIVDRLAAINPEDTLEFLKANDPYGSYYATALAAWASSDLDSALEAFLAVDPHRPRLSELLIGIEREQLDSLYQDFLKRGVDKDYPGIFVEIFPLLAKNDPQGAANLALTYTMQSEGTHDYGPMASVLREWLNQESDHAYLWFNKIEDPKQKRLAASAFLETGYKVETLDAVWDIFNERERKSLIEKFRYPISNIDSLLEWVDLNVDSPTEHKQWLRQFMFNIYTSGHPGKMVDVLPYLEGDIHDYELVHRVRNISRDWSIHDFDGFKKWVNSLENSPLREVAEEVLLQHVDRSPYQEALKEWEQLGDAFTGWDKLAAYPSREIIESTFAAHGNDPQGALDKLPESWRDAALEHYSSLNSTDSPEETLRFLEAQPEGPKRNQEMQRSFANWAAREPSEAAEWVKELPDSEQKEIAAWNLGNTWARTDPAAAMEWVENQPPSPSRDQAAEQAILVGGGHHPEGALSLALTIADHKIRDALVMQTVDRLARRDPDFATEQMRSLNLPAGLAARASQRIQQERALRVSMQR